MPRHYDNASGDPNLGDESAADLAALQQHIGEWWGDGTVWHEIVSEYVHVDLHLIRATADRPHHTLITTGMSDRPMNAPAGREECRYCELLLSLPASWPLSEESFKEEKNWWPCRHLKQKARFPHMFETWVWYTHTVGNGNELAPILPETPFVGFAINLPKLCPAGAHKRHVREGKDVHFFALIPIYEAEIRFAWEHGTLELFKKLNAAGVTELVDVSRPCVITGNRSARQFSPPASPSLRQRIARWFGRGDGAQR